jgi:hypothetical protein
VTDPIPDCPNGLGNLIVGYNERRVGEQNIRTGSHNVVVGMLQDFSRFGGLVVGRQNTISGDFAVVSGGAGNTASGPSTVVSGGSLNLASGIWAVVSGGNGNTASGAHASVSGGQDNEALGNSSSINGGFRNIASGVGTAVGGGESNEASGELSSVSGGESNLAGGIESSISGGEDTTVDTEHGWAAGSIGGEVPGVLLPIIARFGRATKGLASARASQLSPGQMKTQGHREETAVGRLHAPPTSTMG